MAFSTPKLYMMQLYSSVNGADIDTFGPHMDSTHQEMHILVNLTI